MRSPNNAFTLSELAITLSVLGVILGFSISKVLQTSQATTMKERMTKVLNNFEQLFYEENARGDAFNTLSTRWEALKAKVNYTQACGLSAANLAPCLPTGVTSAVDEGAFILNDDIRVYGLLSNATATDVFYVDINGNGEPNIDPTTTTCSDRFEFNLNHITGEVTAINCTATYFQNN